MAASSTRKRLALHWQIVIGLILGLVVGIGVNTATTDSEGNDTFWPGVGVPDRDAFIVHGVAYFPKLPEGTATLQELDPDNPELAAMALSSLTPEFVEKHDLEAKGLIIEPPDIARIRSPVCAFVAELHRQTFYQLPEVHCGTDRAVLAHCWYRFTE